MFKLIDLSNNNTVYSFGLVKAAGIKGMWHKATEGATFTDKKYKERMASARKAGLLVGAYHFASPTGGDAVAEADHFSQVVGTVRPGDLLPVLDMEQNPGNLKPSVLEQWCRDFNQRVKKNIGVLPLFYSYPYFIDKLNASRPIGRGLWLASYGPNDGKIHPYTIPAPWKRVRCHQYTSNGKVKGVLGRVDLNVASDLYDVRHLPKVV